MAVRATLVPRRNDVLLAAGLLVISQVEVWAYGGGGGTLPAALGLGLAAVAIVLRGTYPIATAVLVAVGLAVCATYADEPFSATSVLTVTIAFFSVGAMPRRGPSVAALVVALVLSLFVVQPLTLNNYLGISLSSIGVPWLCGLLWLRRETNRQAEKRRREAAEQAVAAERLRLAQELHDVVSHNVGMIAVQAGAADVLLDQDPERTRESLRAIEGGARETLLELRRLLGLLRDDDPEPLTRRTTLDELPGLIEPIGQSGVHVVLRSSGDPVPLSKNVEMAAYRLVQEALTNVVAHAGPCQVQITLHYAPNALGVEVTDDGTAKQGTTRGGYGLSGIRERVTALGGTVTAGPRPEGGFAVRATLPVAAT
jgi:signal transduction histidine kinase